MKKLFISLALIATIAINAQAPQGFNYQATVRNSSGQLLLNQIVLVKFNILLNSATGDIVYSETQTANTDDLGQINLVVGQGTAPTGTFSTINWGSGSYYLGIELNSGNGYVAMGTTQLLSVPYALYANSSGNSNFNFPNGMNIGDTLNWKWNGSAWIPTSSVSTAQLPVIATTLATNTLTPSPSSGGTITSDGGYSITSKGVCWSTSPNPTINDNSTNNGTGASNFTSILPNLLPITTYYYRAYATNSIGTGYGITYTFATLSKPQITTSAVSSITQTTCSSGGTISSDGGATITAKGVCWSTNPNPTIVLTTKTNDGTGTATFISSITGLLPITTYYVRVYSTNSFGTAYGQELVFTTLPILPTLTTIAATSITSTTASSGGTISSDGGGTITDRGIVWSSTTNPTTTTNQGITSNGAGIGTFTSAITQLTPGTLYYVRAYATNSAGTGYGNQITFSALPLLVTLTTTEITQLTSNSAVTGGQITANGGSTVSQRGVCWSTSTNPTIALTTKTTDGSGSGLFSSSLTQLTPATTYYVRAYATNAVGTAYGNEISFTTLVALPTLTTIDATSITSTTASSGGNITNDGGGAIIARGILWGTNTNPTLTSNIGITTEGASMSSFTSNLTGLNPGTTYYVRAYATNSAGTGYGNQITFDSTVPCIPNNSTLVIDVMSPTGKIWMDRNLGALQQASSSSDLLAYGYLYQWGRGTDGHQCRNSVTTTTLSSSDQPNHGDFISGTSDWRNPQNNNLWQGVNGINNPCPSGYRLPTQTEWNNERLSWSQNTHVGAFNSPLKLPFTGRRVDDTLYGYDAGFYWSSTVGSTLSGTRSQFLSLGGQSQYTNMYEQFRSNGYSVRCIKN